MYRITPLVFPPFKGETQQGNDKSCVTVLRAVTFKVLHKLPPSNTNPNQ
nr:MAG TPA: hypothetical protein [Caudoviricetes sp.]